MRTRIFAVLASFALGTATLAQSTAFTYQGELRQGTNLASGLHDMRFKLFDAVSGGTQVGGTICVNDVPVTDGKFTASIDFEQQFATPTARYLEITVRADIGQPCTDDFGYVTLSPRQLLTAAPLASHALHATRANSAFSLDAADGSPANAVIVDNNGKVGIGTAAPTHSVHVAAAGPTIALQDTNAASQQAGYVSYRDAANIERAWVGYGTAGSPHFSIVNSRTGGDIVLSNFGGGSVRALSLTVAPSGSVGIGTIAPAAALDVRGNIRLGSSGQFFATASEENLRMVRGSVNVSSAGPSISITAGTGFTPTVISRGRYQVVFATPFNGAPTVTATAKAGNCDYIGVIESVSSTGAVILVKVDACGDGAWSGFNFIAVGPR
jgi:hypothetical protein